MLSYLVTSKTRKGLLNLLWRDAVTGSVQELAAKAGVTYGAAHRELAAMEKHGFAVSKGVGKAVVYAANPNAPEAELLRRLLNADEVAPRNEPAQEEVDVIANLQELGAPLTSERPPGRKDAAPNQMSPEETLARALVVSRHNATVLRTLPLVYAKLANQVDLAEVSRKALELRQKRALGFVLDVAGELSKNPLFKQAAARLNDRRVKKDEPYFGTLKSKYEWALAKRNTPALAKKWHWVMNMPMESFQGLYDKFAWAP